MKNCICSAKRKVAKKLANDLVQSILWDKDWKSDCCYSDVLMVREEIRIRLTLGCLGIRDKVTVYHKGARLWFPIIQRMRIRCAVRLRLLWEAEKAI